MAQIHQLREMFFEQGFNISQIAAATGLNWKTVRKYVDMEDFNYPPPKKTNTCNSKLNPYKPLIDYWLQEDRKAPRKQRHTAKRVYDRLQEENADFNCSYRLVALYVAEKKREQRLKRQNGYLPLLHRPGEAQVDFGYADFCENGKLYHDGKYLVLSFPYSNGGYLQLNYGENMECLLEGLVAMFEYIGGVPTEIWFDNTRTIVTDIIRGGGRHMTERFLRFSEHYRFTPVFMNPDAGWEKGNVENKVGYLRRNELVPVPKFDSLKEANRRLLHNCDIDMEKEHYDSADGISIRELFEEDRHALLPLPAVPFNTALYTTAVTNKYGKFTLDNGRHRYSSSPAFSETAIHLKLTAAEVIVMDTSMLEITRHRRLYGKERECMDWIPYLTDIARKPRALRNSGIYKMLPENIRLYTECCTDSERSRLLNQLAELTAQSSFDEALKIIGETIHSDFFMQTK